MTDSLFSINSSYILIDPKITGICQTFNEKTVRAIRVEQVSKKDLNPLSSANFASKIKYPARERNIVIKLDEKNSFLEFNV